MGAAKLKEVPPPPLMSNQCIDLVQMDLSGGGHLPPILLHPWVPQMVFVLSVVGISIWRTKTVILNGGVLVGTGWSQRENIDFGRRSET